MTRAAAATETVTVVGRADVVPSIVWVTDTVWSAPTATSGIVTEYVPSPAVVAWPAWPESVVAVTVDPGSARPVTVRSVVDVAVGTTIVSPGEGVRIVTAAPAFTVKSRVAAGVVVPPTVCTALSTYEPTPVPVRVVDQPPLLRTVIGIAVPPLTVRSIRAPG